ncbi:MAG: thiamine pyrophosphate-dependent enzyme [Pirellulaceae bacterium]|nr:thiamine pyrophosphate-dependent enzyme [Pirellulaceae bacterium]
MASTGIEALLDLLSDFGVRYIFGNPGSTELPLNDALVGDDRFHYILGLQEVPVMSMADGFSMASQSLGVVNLHISCGVGNAMGMLYNAFREGTPLLVTAGQQDRRLIFEEPILWGELVEVTRPWTKYSVEVRRVEDLPGALRRAVQAALTPPTGPVFMSIPVDVQLEWCESLDMSPIRLPDLRMRPPEAAIQQAVKLLLAAENPAIVAGSRITESDAMAELVAVAQTLGTPVFSESGTTHGRLAFPSDHALNAQGLPLWSPEVRQKLSEFDVLLVVGMDLLRQYVYHEPSRAIPEKIRVIHVDEDSRQIGKNYPVEVGIVGATKVALMELNSALVSEMTETKRAAITSRVADLSKRHRVSRQALRDRINSQSDMRPITPACLMGALADILPPDIAVIEEAVTTTNTTFERLGALQNTSGYFGHRGWALGWGLGCSIGAKIAWPQRPVLALLGEGSAMYGIQGLWSAAHHNIPVTFVISNNAQYQILKIGAKSFQLPHATTDRYEGLDLVEPEVDMVAMAQSLGVEARRINEPDELRDAVQTSLVENRLALFDVPISRETQSRLDYG